jgi:TRAP-type C4-dicarboxylate transport system substrate-binding protein
VKKYVVKVVVIAFVLSFFIAPFALAKDKPIKMIIAHHFPNSISNNEVHLSMVRFKDQVESGTNGGIEIEIYPNMILGTEVEYTKEAQQGKTVQCAVLSQGAYASFFKPFMVMSCPFLFKDFNVAWQFLDGKWYSDFMERARKETGLRYLGSFDDGGGFNAFTNRKRVIKTVDDMKGLRIRVEENPAHVAIIEGTGAKAIALEWSQVETTLATGVADGQANAPGLNAAMKFWELVPYSSYVGYMYYILQWVVNDEWFMSLPEDYQKVITRSAREAVWIGHGNAARLTLLGWEEAKKRFKETYVPTPAEKDGFAAKMRPAFRDWYLNDFKGDSALFDSLLQEVDRFHKEMGY